MVADAPATGVVAGYETASGALTSNFGASGYVSVPRVPSSLSLRLGGIGQPQLYVGAFLLGDGLTVSRILIP